MRNLGLYKAFVLFHHTDKRKKRATKTRLFLCSFGMLGGRGVLYHLKIIPRDLGSILILLGLLMLLEAIVSLIFNEVAVLHVVVLTGSLTLCLGLVVRGSCRSAKEPELKHAMITAAVAWLVVPAISSLLFYFIEDMSILDSYFEAMSGWTGTGLTMVAHPSALTYTILFWRSLMQWVGGVGVIVLMVSILARPGTASFFLYKAETRQRSYTPVSSPPCGYSGGFTCSSPGSASRSFTLPG
jgi:trk system potassium uptake protein TrkH